MGNLLPLSSERPLLSLPCPAHTPPGQHPLLGTYPTGTGSGPTAAPCPGSSSSAGIPPSAGCMTFSPAVLPSSLLLVPACRTEVLPTPRLRGENPPLGFIVSFFRGQRHHGVGFRRKTTEVLSDPSYPNTRGGRLPELGSCSLYQGPLHLLPCTNQGGVTSSYHPLLSGCPWPVTVLIMTKEKFVLA